LLVPQKIEDDSRVQVARSCSHGNAARGGEAHRGGDRGPVLQCTQTRAIPQVREDGSLGKRCTEMMHQRLVRNTVETVTTNACVKVALREGEAACNLRHRLMKTAVKAALLRGQGKAAP